MGEFVQLNRKETYFTNGKWNYTVFIWKSLNFESDIYPFIQNILKLFNLQAVFLSTYALQKNLKKQHHQSCTINYKLTFLHLHLTPKLQNLLNSHDVRSLHCRRNHEISNRKTQQRPQSWPFRKPWAIWAVWSQKKWTEESWFTCTFQKSSN